MKANGGTGAARVVCAGLEFAKFVRSSSYSSEDEMLMRLMRCGVLWSYMEYGVIMDM